MTVDNNPFVLEATEYKRDYNILKGYVDDAAKYISKMTGDDEASAREWVKKNILPGGEFPFNDPATLVLERVDGADRRSTNTTFLHFLRHTYNERSLVSPTLTTFIHPEERTSLLSGFVENNMLLRTIDKKAEQEAEMAGNKALAANKRVMQTSRKLNNNSISGAHSSRGTPLYNPSTHPTLTSTCRCATSYANANSERFLAGARWYWKPEMVYNNFVSILNNTDYEEMLKTIENYSISYPAVTDVMEMVVRSTKFYWKIPQELERIREFLDTLTPLELAAILYSQDCFSLASLNPTLIKTMLTDLAEVKHEPIEDPDLYLSQLDEDLFMLVSLLAAQYLEGKQLKIQKVENPRYYAIVAATAKNVLEKLEKYSPIISTFWRTNNPPPSVANMPYMVRRTVVVSDTDSTIFTVAPWVQWTFGELRLDKVGVDVAAVMVYLTSMTLVHLLASYSANMGVVPERIFQLAMKNEYMMESLILTGKSKHYIYRIIAKEGNVYANPKLDIKGVTLRNSKVPKPIMDKVKVLCNDCMDDLRDRGKIALTKYLVRCAELEREIIKSVKNGSSDYLTYSRIMPRETYTKPDQSSYFYYDLWQAVFAAKYGDISDLPCAMVKISMDTENGTKFKKWVSEIEDRPLADKLTRFMGERKRKGLKMLLIPAEIVASNGIPDEILGGSDIRLIIYTTMEAYYLLMESFGYYCKNDKHTRLFMDDF